MRLCLEMWKPSYVMLKIDEAGGYLEMDTDGGAVTCEAADPKGLLALASKAARMMPREKKTRAD